jgi:preprotein translocase subunit SecF
MIQIFKGDTNFDFVGKRNVWFAISLVAIVISVGLFLTKGLNYGIDFTGGAEIHLQVPEGWDITRVREEVDAAGIDHPVVVQLGAPEQSEFLIRASGDVETFGEVSDRIEARLNEVLLEGEAYTVMRSDVVGPAAGRLLREQGILAMIYSLLAILVYVMVRFDSRYAPGLILALFHDAVIVIGAFVITGRAFDLTTLAALLALMGYSNNDTIVIFDRVREVLKLHPDWKVEKAVNAALNQTLGRTFVTSTTTFFVVLALFLFGGPVLESFSFALMVGVVVGTYSSIFIASTLVIYMTHYRQNKAARLRGNQHSQKGKAQKALRSSEADVKA